MVFDGRTWMELLQSSVHLVDQNLFITPYPILYNFKRDKLSLYHSLVGQVLVWRNTSIHLFVLSLALN